MTTERTCTMFSDLLQSVHETVEGVAFSPDSGVSSCSDSEPSSPVLSQLTNADFSTYTNDWLQSDCTVYSTSEDQQSTLLWSMADETPEWECVGQIQLPTCVSEQTSPSLSTVKDEWVETKAGFQVCHTGNGNAKVKLGGGLTYDINLNIDIPDTTSHVVKTELSPGTTSVHYEKYMCFGDMNNNIVNDNTAFQAYQDENCNNCYGNRTSSYGMNHCAPYRYHDPSIPHAREESPDDRLTTSRKRQFTRTERLWEFILRLLGDPKHNPRLIEWVDREDGMFRLNNSKAIALMWGMRKNNGQMTYEKLSRALRYYYHRNILEPVLGKKLVYRFGPNATQVWENRVYRPQPGSR